MNNPIGLSRSKRRWTGIGMELRMVYHSNSIHFVLMATVQLFPHLNQIRRFQRSFKLSIVPKLSSALMLVRWCGIDSLVWFFWWPVNFWVDRCHRNRNGCEFWDGENWVGKCGKIGWISFVSYCLDSLESLMLAKCGTGIGIQFDCQLATKSKRYEW